MDSGQDNDKWTKWEECNNTYNAIGFRIQTAGKEFLKDYVSESVDIQHSTNPEYYGLTRIQLLCAPRIHYPIQ